MEDNFDDWLKYKKTIKPLRIKEKVLGSPPSTIKLDFHSHKKTPTNLNFSQEGGAWDKIDRKTIRKRKLIDATLDLHGFNFTQALDKVVNFISSCYRNGLSHVIIITGRGRGENSLQREVPIWLTSDEIRGMVLLAQHAKEGEGGSGVLHVFLKKTGNGRFV